MLKHFSILYLYVLNWAYLINIIIQLEELELTLDMARNFKMFDHVVAPETRYRSWALMRSKPLEMFLCFQFVYMLFSLFSYRSLLNSYLMLTIYCFIISYLDYFKTII